MIVPRVICSLVSLFFILISSTVKSAGQSLIEKAVAHPDRTALDRNRDKVRKPIEVLAFFDIKTDQTVVDILAGSGYYSELISHAVGDSGRVILHNDAHFLKYYGKSLSERLGNGKRLPNVERIDQNLNQFNLEENSVDGVLVILGFHDFYYKMKGAEKIDVKSVLANIQYFLRPSGIVGIVDHEAKTGSPRAVGNTLHRIDPQIVIAEMKNSGFELTGSLDILVNSSDEKSQSIWDIDGGRTSRFVLRFRNGK
jgi:predicted methyltransferase